MKKYNVIVNGTSYEIEIELISETDAAGAAKATPAPVQAPAGGTQVSSPMPGTILTVNVQEGQAVKKGQVLMILEAMKMENEIMAPCDGTVKSVNVSKGAAVENNTVLCVIG